MCLYTANGFLIQVPKLPSFHLTSKQNTIKCDVYFLTSLNHAKAK